MENSRFGWTQRRDATQSRSRIPAWTSPIAQLGHQNSHRRKKSHPSDFLKWLFNSFFLSFDGAPGEIRTPDLLIRSRIVATLQDVAQKCSIKQIASVYAGIVCVFTLHSVASDSAKVQPQQPPEQPPRKCHPDAPRGPRESLEGALQGRGGASWPPHRGSQIGKRFDLPRLHVKQSV